jgi:hypothetical protein
MSRMIGLKWFFEDDGQIKVRESDRGVIPQSYHPSNVGDVATLFTRLRAWCGIMPEIDAKKGISANQQIIGGSKPTEKDPRVSGR